MNCNQYRALGKFIIIRPEEEPERKSKGGIIMVERGPDGEKKHIQLRRGRVLSISREGSQDTGVEAGQTVLYDWAMAMQFTTPEGPIHVSDTDHVLVLELPYGG